MRLIDADAERERLKKGYCEECTRKGNYGIFGAACTPCWVKDAIEEFDNAQTVEAKPVRHGQWIEGTSRGSYSIYCSYCCSQKETICPSDYCPNCGARMDAADINVLTKDGGGDE